MTDASEWESGGLQFKVFARPPRGCTIEVFGTVDGVKQELLRFDDFVEMPHFHVPADGPQTAFDRSFGEPLAWFVAQIDGRLEALLTEAGFAKLLPDLDLSNVHDNARRVNEAAIACTLSGPDGFIREPGFGLKLSASA